MQSVEVNASDIAFTFITLEGAYVVLQFLIVALYSCHCIAINPTTSKYVCTNGHISHSSCIIRSPLSG